MNQVTPVALLRWIAVVPAGVLGWYLALLTGLTLLSGATALCPADRMVSGACVAPLFPYVETAIIYVSVALAAFLVVELPVLTAPRWRSTVAWVAFVAGLMLATYFVVYTTMIVEFVIALIIGLLSVAGVVRAERRRPR